MAFVPGFRHDIFVSYAHVDDTPDPDFDEGWVTALVRRLKIRLARHLGRSEVFELWMDHELAVNRPLGDELMSLLDGSAILLMFQSKAYVASDWCRRECETFLTRFQQRTGSVFIVEPIKLDPDEMELLPSQCGQLLGVRFWTEDTLSKTIRTLGYPAPTKDDRAYYGKLDALAQRLAEELERQRDASPAPAVTALAPNNTEADDQTPFETDSTEQDADETAEESEDEPVRVYLAEVTDDIDLLRDKVRRHLGQYDWIKIVPELWLPRDPDEFRRIVDEHVESVDIFLQLLSHVVRRKIPGFEEGYVGYQLSAAQNRGLPLLQWRSPELTLEAIDRIEDAAAQMRLRGSSVLVGEIEEFCHETLKLAESIRDRRNAERAAVQPPLPGGDGGALVFVNADSSDGELANQVREYLEQRGHGVALPIFSGSPEEIRNELQENLLDCDAVAVVYGRIAPTWVRQQLRHYRKSKYLRPQPVKAVAVFDGPPTEKQPLNFSLPRMLHVDCRRGVDDATMSQFLSAIVNAPANE